MRQNNISCVDRYALRFAFVLGPARWLAGPLITDFRLLKHMVWQKENKNTASQRYDGKWSDYIWSVDQSIALITGLNKKEVQALAGFY